MASHTFKVQPNATVGVDSYIDSGAPTTNYATTTPMILGRTSAGNTKRALFRFNVSNIPVGATLTSATLTIPISGGTVSATTTWYCNRLTQTAWTETGVTWNDYSVGNAWAAPGGDYTTTDRDSYTYAGVPPSLIFSAMTALVQDAITNRSGILDLIIVSNSESGSTNRFLSPFCSDSAAASRPILVVTYTAPGVQFQAAGTITGGTFLIFPAWPPHTTNDIGILLIESANSAVTLDDLIALGWAELTSSPQGIGTANSTDATRITALWKRAVSEAEASLTVSNSGGNHVCAQVITFSGCRISDTPLDATAGGTQTSTVNMSVAGVTAAEGGNQVLYVTARDEDTGSARWSGEANASLTSVVERADAGTGAGNGGGLGVWTGILASPGATGTLTATASVAQTMASICATFLSSDYTSTVDPPVQAIVC